MSLLRFSRVGTIFSIAQRDGIPSWKAADRLAEERIQAIAKVRRFYSQRFKDRLSGRRPHTTATNNS